MVGSSFSLLFTALLFSGALISVNAADGWWLDSLFGLWASDASVPFNVVFNERILPNSNPPLYFLLLYFVRLFISNDRAAVLALNVFVIILASIAVYWPSRRVGLQWLAIVGIASFVLSGPTLFFFPEARAYLIALAIVFVTSWYVALVVSGFSERIGLYNFAILGCLAALTHAYAALFCGCLATGLFIVSIFWGRKEFFSTAVALGLSATIVFVIWFATIGVNSLYKSNG